MDETIPAPTEADMARDLAADLAVCDAATSGPWSHDLELDDPDGTIEASCGGCVCHIQHHGNINTVARTGEHFSHADARMIASARTGWPAAIRRAIHAEALAADRLVAIAELSRDRDAAEARVAELEQAVRELTGSQLDY